MLRGLGINPKGVRNAQGQHQSVPRSVCPDRGNRLETRFHCYIKKRSGEAERDAVREEGITNLLRAGIDARTVMKYFGHDDLETILRYLAPAESAETQAKVNAIIWTR